MLAFEYLPKLYFLYIFVNFRPSQNMDNVENWRSGRTSICESDDGRRTPMSYSTSTTNTGPSSIHRQSPTIHANAHHPGVLVLPDQTQLTSNACVRQPQVTQQQKRTLFDPNNPNKPIVVNSPGNRIGPQNR